MPERPEVPVIPLAPEGDYAPDTERINPRATDWCVATDDGRHDPIVAASPGGERVACDACDETLEMTIEEYLYDLA